MNVLNPSRGIVHRGLCALPAEGQDGVNSSYVPQSEQLLREVFYCLPPQLQKLIKEEDLERVKDLVNCIVKLGDPVTCRGRVAGFERFKNEWDGTQAVGPEHDAMRAALFLEAPSLFLSTEDVTRAYRVGRVPYGCPPHVATATTTAAAGNMETEKGVVSCTWSGTMERLMNYCDALRKILAAEEGYRLPKSLQRRVVPALYAWLTDYDFLLDNATYWLTVAKLMTKIGYPPHGLEVVLPWRPLAALVINLVKEREPSKQCGRFSSVVCFAGSVLPRLCEVASMYFDADALEEMWLEFSPKFVANGEEGCIYLSILCSLLPVRQLRSDTGAGGYVNPLVKRIVHFLLREAYDLQLQQREFWLVLTFQILSRMFATNEGLVSLDEYSEPLFSSILQLLHLPIGNDPRDPFATAGMASTKQSQSKRRVKSADCTASEDGASFADSPGGPLSVMFFLDFASRSEKMHALSVVVNGLTNDTSSPLWSQLRRLLHATSVFIRPGVSTVEAANEVCKLYNRFVSTAHRRVRRQSQHLRWHESRRCSTGAEQRAADDEVEGTLPTEHIWTRRTIDVFVELLAPVLMPALHLHLSGINKSMALLISLSPAQMLPRLQKYITAALHSPTNVEQQRARVLRLLSAAAYPMLAHPDTQAYLLDYLSVSLPQLVGWIGPSAPHVTPNLIHILFSIAAVLPLRRLFATPAAESEGMVRFFEQVVAVCEGKRDEVDMVTLSSARTILQTLSEEAYKCVVERLFRSVEDQSSGLCKICLLIAVGRRGETQLLDFARRVAVPVILNRGTNDAITTWATRVLCACISGAGRDAVFMESKLIVQCINALITHITSVRRLGDARLLFVNLADVLLRYECTASPPLPCGGGGDAGLGDASPPATEGDNNNSNHDTHNDANNDGGAVSRGAEEPCAMTSLDEVDPQIAAGARLLRGLGFCSGRDVKLCWDGPNRDHVAFMMDLCDDFIGAAMEVAANVQHVTPATDPCSGLLGLLALSPGRARDETSAERSTDADRASFQDPNGANSRSNCSDFEDGSESAEEFTPHNVLHGCATWMRYVYLACMPLYYVGADGSGGGDDQQRQPAVMHLERVPVTSVRVLADAAWTEHKVAWCPYWYLSERCALPLPRPTIPSSGSTADTTYRRLKHDRATLFEFVCTHMLRRFCGDPATELKKTFGGKAGEVFDLDLLISGEPPLDARRIEQGDARALEGVLSFLIALTGLFSNKTFPHVLRLEGKVPLCEIELNYHEKIRHVQLFPAEYWVQRATYVVNTYVASAHHLSCSVDLCGKLLNVTHLLRFLQPRGRVQSFCDSVLSFMLRIFTPPLRRVFFACHLDAINRLTELWSRKIAGEGVHPSLEAFASRATCTGGPAPPPFEDASPERLTEKGGACSGAEDDTRQRADSFHTAEARAVVDSGMQIALYFFRNHRSFENPDILYHILRLLTLCPDRLLGSSVKTTFQQLVAAVLSLVPYADRETTHWLVEEAILLGYRLAAVSPTRACVCVGVAFAMHHPHGDEPWRMLSTRAIQVLFMLSTKPFHNLCSTSISFLTVIFRSVCEPASGVTHVLMRRSRVCASHSACDHPQSAAGDEGGSPLQTKSSPQAGDPPRGALDSSEDADHRREDLKIFKRRYTKLREWVPFFRVEEGGQHFIPLYITVPAGRECFPSHLFEGDGMPLACTDDDGGNDVVHCDVLRRRHFVETCQGDREAVLRQWGRVIAVFSGLASQPLEGTGLHERKGQVHEKNASADLREFQLSTSCQEGGGADGAAAERVRGMWVWAVVGSLKELCDSMQKSFSAAKMWVLLGRVVGYERCIRNYVLVVRLQLDDLSEKLHRKDQTAKESPQGQFAVLMDLCLASLQLSKEYVLREWAIHASNAANDSLRASLPPPHADTSLPTEFTSIPEATTTGKDLRGLALQCYVDTLLYTCQRSVPNEVSRLAATTFGRLNNSVNAEETWWLFETLLNSLITSTDDEKHEVSYEDISSQSPLSRDMREGFLCAASGAGTTKVSANMQKTVRIMMYLSQIVLYTEPEWTGELLAKLTQCIRVNQGLFFSSATSYASFWTASVPRLLLRWCLNQSDVIPSNHRLLEAITAFALEVIAWAPIAAFASATSLSPSSSPSSSPSATPSEADENEAAAAMRGAPAPASGDSNRLLPGGGGGGEGTPSWLPTPACSARPDVAFLTPAIHPRPSNVLGREEADGEEGGVPLPARADVLRPASAEKAAARGVVPTPSLAPQHVVLGATGSSVFPSSGPQRGAPSPSLLPTPMMGPLPTSVVPLPETAALFPLKTVLFCFQLPPAALVAGCAEPLLTLLIAALNLSFAEGDPLHSIAENVLASLVGLRLPKSVVHKLLHLLCDALMGQAPGGVCSHRCRSALTQALCVLIFNNTHRIGKYVVMQRVAEAALQAIGHKDGRLRAQGSHLFAVLTKVASTEQTVALLQTYAKELRYYNFPAPNEGGVVVPASGTSEKRRYVALVLLQCAALSADPGTIPAYIPKLMERLAPYSRSPIVEVQRVVKKSFEAWWRSHREGWEVEYKNCFTPSQLEAISTLLMTPTYYV